ncbi:MAG: hypothetical protein ACRDL7_04345, partial [Gaiellaceae bacterium]
SEGPQLRSMVRCASTSSGREVPVMSGSASTEPRDVKPAAADCAAATPSTPIASSSPMSCGAQIARPIT